MTEKQWLACTDPTLMLAFLHSTGRISDRGFRSFMEACCDGILRRTNDLVVLLRAAEFLKKRLAEGDLLGAAREVLEFAANTVADLDADACGFSPSHPGWWDLNQLALTDQSDMLRDIVGNPFQLVAISESWRTPEAVAIATTIDETQAFSLLPALGAALSDAGCEETSILEHCRMPNHVKGCFLVDALLGKGFAQEADG